MIHEMILERQIIYVCLVDGYVAEQHSMCVQDSSYGSHKCSCRATANLNVSPSMLPGPLAAPELIPSNISEIAGNLVRLPWKDVPSFYNSSGLRGALSASDTPSAVEFVDSALFSADAAYGIDDEYAKKRLVLDGVVLFGLRSYIDSLLLQATDTCSTTANNSEAIASWNRAVTLFRGDQDGEPSPYLFLGRAMRLQKMFQLIRKPIIHLPESFEKALGAGTEAMLSRNCRMAKKRAREVSELLYALVVQEAVVATTQLLDLGYSSSTASFRATKIASVAALVPSILPCNKTSAEFLGEINLLGLSTEQWSQNLAGTLQTLESELDCLGMNCDGIGASVRGSFCESVKDIPWFLQDISIEGLICIVLGSLMVMLAPLLYFCVQSHLYQKRHFTDASELRAKVPITYTQQFLASGSPPDLRSFR